MEEGISFALFSLTFLGRQSYFFFFFSEVKVLSRVRLFATPWSIAHQAPLSMGFSRQEYWSGLPFPSPGNLPNSGIEPRSPALQADALTSEPPVYSKTNYEMVTSGEREGGRGTLKVRD